MAETTTYKVTFSVNVPKEIPKTSVEEWVKFNLGETNHLPVNPLSNTDLEANRYSVTIY